MQLIIALVLTIIIEAAVMYLLTQSWEWCRFNLYCNLVTNPLLNFALLGTGYVFKGMEDSVLRALLSYYVPLVIGEAVVFYSEGWLYSLMTDCPKKKCYRLSVITNAVSAAIGLVISFFYYF